MKNNQKGDGMKQTFYADKFFLMHEVKEKGYLLIENGVFSGFKPNKPSTEYDLTDYSGKWIAPGLVDTHIHGIFDYDVMDNHLAGLKTMSRALLQCGVTSFLPTTLTSSVPEINSTVQTIGEQYHTMEGAKIQGIFIEGPFFTEKYKGAQNAKYFLPPDMELLNQWQTLAKGLIKKIAIAPEYPEATEFIRAATKQGIVVALAHSDATYEQAVLAVEQGASMFTHTFNGMSGLHHREPGMIGAALSLKGVYNELICDWQHVHPVTSKILLDATGRNRMVLISDSIKAALMPEGTYNLGEFQVTVKDGQARIPSGNLAGSVLLLKDAVKNVVEQGLATVHEAINMASIIPAKSVGIDHLCGKISVGHPADFIVLDKKLDLHATYVSGNLLYHT